MGTARPIDARIVRLVKVDDEKIEDVIEVIENRIEFCFLGYMLSAEDGCKLATLTRCKCALGKFRQLLPFLANHNLSLLTQGRVNSSCVKNVLVLHAVETWAMMVVTLNPLWRNDRAMIR